MVALRQEGVLQNSLLAADISAAFVVLAVRDREALEAVLRSFPLYSRAAWQAILLVDVSTSEERLRWGRAVGCVPPEASSERDERMHHGRALLGLV